MLEKHAIAAAILSIASLVAHATPTTTIRAGVNAGGFGILDETQFSNTSSGSQSWSGSANFNSPFPSVPGNGGSVAGAFVDFGVLKAAAAGSCSGGCGTNGFAAISFSDALLIDRPDLRGQVGYLTTTIEYYWSGTTTNVEVVSDGVRYASYAQADVGLLLSGLGLISADQLAASGGPFQPARLQVSDLAGTIIDVPFSWTAQVTTPFAFGNSLPFTMSLSVGTYAAGAYGPDGNSSLFASASLAADRSAYWGGMVVTLADGTVVNDYELTSGSGVDWRNSFAPMSPIPEPSSVLLMLVGLGLLTQVRRLRSPSVVPCAG